MFMNRRGHFDIAAETSQKHYATTIVSMLQCYVRAILRNPSVIRIVFAYNCEINMPFMLSMK